MRPVSLLLPIDLVDVWRVVTTELSHAGFPADAIRSLLAPSEQPRPHRGDEARVRVKRHSIVESRLSCPRFVRRRCTSPASGSTPYSSCRCPRCATTEGLAAIRRARRRTSRLLSQRTRVANAPRDGLRVSRHGCASRLCALDSCDTQVPAFTLPLASATGSTVSTVGSCTLCAGLTPTEARRARSPGYPRERGAYRSRRESSRRHVGAAPAVTPVFSTDVCKPTIDGSKNGYPPSSRCTPRRIPTRRGSSRFHAEVLASASGPISRGISSFANIAPACLWRFVAVLPAVIRRACLVSSRGGRSKEAPSDPGA